MLDSILDQTYDKLQLILADSGSADRTLEIAESYRDPFARRKGYEYVIVRRKPESSPKWPDHVLSCAKGEFLAFADGNDILAPDSIKKRAIFLGQHPQYHVVRSFPEFFDSPTGRPAAAEEKIGQWNKEYLFWELLKKATYARIGCYLFLTADFFEICPVDRAMRYGTEQSLNILLPYLYRYSCATIPEHLYRVRVDHSLPAPPRPTPLEEWKSCCDLNRLVDFSAGVCPSKNKDDLKRIDAWKKENRRAFFRKYLGYPKKLLDKAAKAHPGQKLFSKKQASENPGSLPASPNFLKAGILYNVPQNAEQIALTFDATWGNENTGRLLDILKQHHAKATFFLSGIWMEAYPDLVKRIHADGHEIGNHTYNHRDMGILTEKQNREDIERTQEICRKMTGMAPHLFRLPFGSGTPEIVRLAASENLCTVGWTIDSLDWKEIALADSIKRLNKAHGGDIVLMHNAGKYTPELLKESIPRFRHKGYEPVTVSELTGGSFPAKNDN